MENSQKRLKVLKTSSEFNFLKTKGKRYSPTNWMVLNYIKNDKNVFRCGWTISSKVGSSVLRNKLKRWCREYFRDAIKKNHLMNIDVNVIFKPNTKEFYEKLRYSDVATIFDGSFETIHKRIS